MANKAPHDYRINFKENGNIISIEIRCCNQYAGEIRFRDGESRRCSLCNTLHGVRIEHNHFHITRTTKEEEEEVTGE